MSDDVAALRSVTSRMDVLLAEVRRYERKLRDFYESNSRGLPPKRDAERELEIHEEISELSREQDRLIRRITGLPEAITV